MRAVHASKLILCRLYSSLASVLQPAIEGESTTPVCLEDTDVLPTVATPPAWDCQKRSEPILFALSTAMCTVAVAVARAAGGE